MIASLVALVALAAAPDAELDRASRLLQRSAFKQALPLLARVRTQPAVPLPRRLRALELEGIAAARLRRHPDAVARFTELLVLGGAFTPAPRREPAPVRAARAAAVVRARQLGALAVSSSSPDRLVFTVDADPLRLVAGIRLSSRPTPSDAWTEQQLPVTEGRAAAELPSGSEWTAAVVDARDGTLLQLGSRESPMRHAPAAVALAPPEAGADAGLAGAGAAAVLAGAAGAGAAATAASSTAPGGDEPAPAPSPDTSGGPDAPPSAPAPDASASAPGGDSPTVAAPPLTPPAAPAVPMVERRFIPPITVVSFGVSAAALAMGTIFGIASADGFRQLAAVSAEAPVTGLTQVAFDDLNRRSAGYGSIATGAWVASGVFAALAVMLWVVSPTVVLVPAPGGVAVALP